MPESRRYVCRSVVWEDLSAKGESRFAHERVEQREGHRTPSIARSVVPTAFELSAV